MDNTTPNWRGATISLNSTIQDAIQNLDRVALKIVMVIDDQGKLEGTISDGDIRRGLLKGLDLKSPIIGIIHRQAFVVPPGLPQEMVLQLMTANKIQQIPIVDNENHVIGLHLWDEVASPMQYKNKMVIMAGGKGTRLMPHTQYTPKPMVSVNGKPMLEHIIERAKSEGFCNFTIAVHHLSHIIEDYFGNGDKFKVNIDYLHEESPLGTAGALGLLDPLPGLPIVVTNGDVLTDVHYGEILEFHNRQDASATMAVKIHEWQHPYGVVHTDGIDIIGFEEKPITKTHINAGVYVISPKCLAILKANDHCDMPSLFENLKLNRFKTVAYPMHEPWLDVGRPSDLAIANSGSILIR